MATTRVAVLGMGTMGAAMARSLLRARLEVTVWNRTPEKAKPLAQAGARVASDPADAVRDADVVLTMLFDVAAVQKVAAEFLPAMPAGAIWMQSSTIGDAGMQAVAAAASVYGVAVVDAPVLGTKDPAEHAALTVLASGETHAVATLRPVFDAIGSRTIVVGERLGAASDLKLVCNTWVASLTAGTAQSLVLARTFGLDPALGLLKDLRLAQATAGASHATPYLDGLERLYAAESDAGHGRDDVAWVYDAIDAR